MGREAVVAVTKGKLDFGTWERIFYGEWDGRRPKRILDQDHRRVGPLPALGLEAERDQRVREAGPRSARRRSSASSKRARTVASRASSRIGRPSPASSPPPPGRARGAARRGPRSPRRRRRSRGGPARPSPSGPGGARTRRGAPRGRRGASPAARRRARSPARRAPRSSGRRRPRPTRRARGPAPAPAGPAAWDGSARSGRCVSDRATRRPPRSSVPRVAFSNVRIPRSQSMTSAPARGEEVLGRREPLLDGRPEPALQEDRAARAPGLAQEVVVLAVSRADLEDVRLLGHLLDLARRHDLRDDRQADGVARRLAASSSPSSPWPWNA